MLEYVTVNEAQIQK